MRSKPIESSPKNMRGLRLVGGGESGPAFSPYGPVKVGLTTSHKTQSQVLSEWLSLLEKRVDDLTYKYLEASSILTSVMTDLVRLGLIGNGLNTIDEEDNKE